MKPIDDFTAAEFRSLFDINVLSCFLASKVSKLIYKLNELVMQRFGNLKVGSVFDFLHPETAVSVSDFGFQKDIYIF